MAKNSLYTELPNNVATVISTKATYFLYKKNHHHREQKKKMTCLDLGLHSARPLANSFTVKNRLDR